jgi:hypothetical protein
MTRLAFSLVLTVAASLAVTTGCVLNKAKAAPDALCPTNGPMTVDQFHDHVDCLARGIKIVWEEDLREAVAITPSVPAVPGDLRLEVVRDCALIPYHKPTSKLIGWPHSLTYYTLYFQQALALYVMDLDGKLSPAGIVDFFERQMQAKLIEHRRGCPGSEMQESGRIPDQLPSVLDGRVTQVEYEALWSAIANSPTADELQAYLAVGPIMFVLLHEAGHAVLHPQGTNHSLDDELEADRYAAAVFRSSELPVMVALGLHQMIYQYSDHAGETGLDCRLNRLAAENPIPEDFARKFGQSAAQRLEELRVFYVEHYGAACTRKP